LGDRLVISFALEPLNCSTSLPDWPSTASLSSPGFQTNTSAPSPSSAVSLPLPGCTVSASVPPSTTSLNCEPRMSSAPAPLSTVTEVSVVNAAPLTPDSPIAFAPGPPITFSWVTAAQATAPVPGGGAPLTATLPASHVIAIPSAPLLETVSVPALKLALIVAQAEPGSSDSASARTVRRAAYDMAFLRRPGARHSRSAGPPMRSARMVVPIGRTVSGGGGGQAIKGSELADGNAPAGGHPE
jgi:hypothetical protein